MERLGTGADAVLTPMAAEAIIASAESGARSAGLEGRVREDARGRFYEITGVGRAEVGMCAVSPDGGTEPDAGMLSELRASVGHGVLAVVDPYAGELAFYVVDADSERPASAVMSERSDPDRVAVPHVLLGGAVAPHEVADDAVEEQERGVLEDRAQGRRLPYAVPAGHVHDYRDV